MVLSKKLWNYGKNNGNMKKSYNTMKKLWYYTENYGTLLCYGKKNMVL